MAYRYRTRIQAPEGEREVYFHAGKDVDAYVVDSIARRIADNPDLIFKTQWSDYLVLRSPYDNEDYRLYQQDKWTFYVEL